LLPCPAPHHAVPLLFFLLLLLRPPRSTLFPYTTLFRSKVTFVVRERPFVRDVDFVGNKAVKTTELQDKVDLKLGSVYNPVDVQRSEEHTSELQSRFDLVCRLLLEKKKRHVRQNLSTTRT